MVADKSCRLTRSRNLSATVIQQAWRRYYARTAEQRRLTSETRAATVIQRHWRGFQTREVCVCVCVAWICE